MSNIYFEILRPGINTTIQDCGRNHMYHEGIAVSGAIDQRNFKLANKLVNNILDEAVIEFAYQGPLLKLKNNKLTFSITGDVIFKIIRNNSKVENGKCYKNYILEEDDQLDIISTKNTAYGYLSVNGGFQLEKIWDSYFNKYKKLILGQTMGKNILLKIKIFIKNSKFEKIKKIELNYLELQDNIIRVIKGTKF